MIFEHQFDLGNITRMIFEMTSIFPPKAVIFVKTSLDKIYITIF